MITEIAFTAFRVTDLAKARAFYEGVLGLTLTTEYGGVWIEYDIGAGTFVIQTVTAEEPTGNRGAIAFEVDDLDATVATLKAAGTPFIMETNESPVCRFTMVTDPDGNPVMIHKRKGGSGSRRAMIPGEIIVGGDPAMLAANVGLATRVMVVANTGDRPVQVGSHFHFYEVNAALRFEREQARGFRLNIAAGTAVRFEPGDQREVRTRRAGGRAAGVRAEREGEWAAGLTIRRYPQKLLSS